MTDICARTKVVAAAISAGVVVTTGVLLNGTEAHAVTATIEGPANTSTQGTPPPTPPTKMAVPPLKAKKWHGGGWPGQ